jgi:hypothetical protein
MSTLRNSLVTTALALAVGLSCQAQADIVIKATDGVNTVMADDHANPGLATYSGAIGNFTLSVDIGTGFPQVGSPSDAILDLNSLDLTTGTAGGTLTVSLTETDFTGAPGTFNFLSSITGNYVHSTASMNTYLDTTDAHFGTGTLLSGGLVDNQAAGASTFPGAGPYSLTEIVTVTAGANSLTSLDTTIIQTPEPGSLPLLGAALLALGMIGAGASYAPPPRAPVALR